ncbi:MAG: alpha/beta hydrolase [Enterocloster sp.]
MDIRHFTITVTSEECGHRRADKEGADLTAYLLSPLSQAPDRRRPAVILCPGGGYRFVSPREDQPVAMEYLAAGCQVFVLHYHVSPERYPTALMELARTVALVREHADEWHIDPENILVSGFSAGGHLACCLGAMWNRPALFEPLKLTGEQIRPDGMILCYPVITSGEKAHKGSFTELLGPELADDEEMRRQVSLEYQIGPHTPRTFLWHTWTDNSVPVENSLLLAQSLRTAGVSLELHIYPYGNHGLSLATDEVSGPDRKCNLPHCQGWIKLAKEWIYQKEAPVC